MILNQCFEFNEKGLLWCKIDDWVAIRFILAGIGLVSESSLYAKLISMLPSLAHEEQSGSQ